MIKAYKCVPVVQELHCDDCEVKMERQPIAYTSDPMKFEYKCPKCGNTTITTGCYPRIGYANYEEIENFTIVEVRD